MEILKPDQDPDLDPYQYESTTLVKLRLPHSGAADEVMLQSRKYKKGQKLVVNNQKNRQRTKIFLFARCIDMLEKLLTNKFKQIGFFGNKFGPKISHRHFKR